MRAGDFVQSLLRNAKTVDELAFAVGALSHYVGDTIGHSAAVNLSVPKEFPKLESKYGPVVNYEESPHAHVRTEFAFDINELEKGRFAPSGYLKHVGLNVATNLLARAFYEVYGLDLYKTIGDRRPIIRGYRFGVRRFLPSIAYAETVLHRKTMPQDTAGADMDCLERELKQAEAENGWEQYRKRPGIGTYSLAGLIFVLPKVGVFSNLAIRGPSVETEDLYVKSLNRTTDSLRGLLARLERRQLKIDNRDLDTGEKVRPGSYRLTDKTYTKLLAELTKDAGLKVPEGVKRDVVAYCTDPGYVKGLSAKQQATVHQQVLMLTGMGINAEPWIEPVSQDVRQAGTN